MFSHRFRVIVGSIVVASMVLFGFSWFMQKQGPIYQYKSDQHKAQLLKIFDQNYFWLTTEANPFSAHANFERALDTLSSSIAVQDRGNLSVAVYYTKRTAQGFVSYYMLTPTRGKILHLAVDENSRRQGIAAKLLDYAIGELEKCGAKKIELLTRIKNERAQGLYYKYGFVPVNAYDEYVTFERNQKKTIE